MCTVESKQKHPDKQPKHCSLNAPLSCASRIRLLSPPPADALHR